MHACLLIILLVMSNSVIPPGSSVPGISKARILEWIAIAFSIIYVYTRLNGFLINIYCVGMIIRALCLSARGKNKERVHVCKNIMVCWLRNFRIRTIIKQQKGINAEAAGHYESETQLCMTLCNYTDIACQAPVQGILQARIMEWATGPFSRGSSQCRDWTQVSHIAGRCSRLSAPPEKDTMRREQTPDYWDSNSSLEEVIFESIYLASKEYCR